MKHLCFFNDFAFGKSKLILSIAIVFICFRSHILAFPYRIGNQTLEKNNQNMDSKNAYYKESLLNVKELLENFIGLGDVNSQRKFFNIPDQFNLGEQVSPDGNLIAAITSKVTFDKIKYIYQLDYYIYIYDKNTKETFTDKIAWCKLSDSRGEVPDSYLLAFGFTSSSQIYVVGNDRILFLSLDKNKITDGFYVKTKQKLLGYHSFMIELIEKVEGSTELYKPADLNTLAHYFPKDDLILLIPCGRTVVGSDHGGDIIFIYPEKGQNIYLTIGGCLAYGFSPDKKYLAIYSRTYENKGCLNIIDMDYKKVFYSSNIPKFIEGVYLLWLSNRTVATFTFYNPYMIFEGRAVLLSIFDLELKSEVSSSDSILNLRTYNIHNIHFLDLLNALMLKSTCFKPQKNELETEREFQQRLADILNRCNELQKEAYKYFQNKTIPVLFPASLGKYSADNEEFIMNFLNRSLALKVKRDIAPTLIQKRDKGNVFYVDGEIKLVNKETFRLINPYFIAPDSDIKIPIFN